MMNETEKDLPLRHDLARLDRLLAEIVREQEGEAVYHEMRTIPVGLAAFVGQYATAWSLLMAGSVIALLPVLVIYMFGQKWFVQGIALSGISGR